MSRSVLSVAALVCVSLLCGERAVYAHGEAARCEGEQVDCYRIETDGVDVLLDGDGGATVSREAMRASLRLGAYDGQQAPPGARALKENGISGKRYRMESKGVILWKKGDNDFVRIESNGVHEFLLVDGKVYDNLNPQGMLVDDFNKRLVFDSQPKITTIDSW